MTPHRTCGTLVLLLLSLGALARPLLASAESSPDSAAIIALVMSVPYGVPSSPAFELLPNKPDLVTHASTPNDFQAGLVSWLDGSRMRVGVAADTRPLVRAAGSPSNYRRHWWRQAAFRMTLAAGTALATSGSKDVITSFGVRVPIIDLGDSRADPKFAQSIIEAINQGLSSGEQPRLDETLAQTQARIDRASNLPEVDKIRGDFSRLHWNSPRVELGAAGSVTSREGALQGTDRSTQGGVWVGISGPLWRGCRVGQLTALGKSIWSRVSADSDETDRKLGGARIRGFWSESFTTSLEAARIWSRHTRDATLNEHWNHYAAVMEWRVVQLKGWVGIAYGGDTRHRGQQKDEVSLRYALYRKAILSR